MNWNWSENLKFKDYNYSGTDFSRSNYESILSNMLYNNKVKDNILKSKLLSIVKDIEYTEFEEVNE